MGYIYKITNIKNNKCYIGETIQNPKKGGRITDLQLNEMVDVKH